MPAWRVAKSLEVLRAQINAEWPKRSKASDGFIGDAAHQARPSDHNPNSAGVVAAFDITHDPKNGPDIRVLGEVFRQNRDSRIKYVIAFGRIFFGDDPSRGNIKPWKWVKYTGSADPHENHLHLSVRRVNYDHVNQWIITKEEAMPTEKNVKDYFRAYKGEEPTKDQIRHYTKNPWSKLLNDLLKSQRARIKKLVKDQGTVLQPGKYLVQ